MSEGGLPTYFFRIYFADGAGEASVKESVSHYLRQGPLRRSTVTGTAGGSIALLGTGWTAPFVEERECPLVCAVISGRIWVAVRATVTLPPFVAEAFADCLALLGGFFADRDGEGEVDGITPFVCIPAGIGRFGLGCGGIMGGGIGVVLGAMATVCS